MKALRFLGLLPLLLALALACAPQTGAPAASKPAAQPTSAGSAAPSTAASKPAGGQAAQAGGVTVRMAMILPGPIQDADYNALGAQALDTVKQQTGAETAFSESVAVADAERVAREYLNSGYNVIAFHGGQFLTIAQKLAPAYPDRYFIIESSGQVPDLPPNTWNMGRKYYQGFYPIGVLAAASTQTGKLGYVAGVRLPDFVAVLNALKQAARDTKPGLEIVDAFVGDQNDPVKARQATASQINSGVDFVVATVNLGINGVAEAAKAAPRPVLFNTYYTEKPELAPDRLTVSLLMDFGTPYAQIVKNIQSGQAGGYVELRPGNGMSLSEIRNVPPEAAQKAREAFDAVAAGRLQLPEITDRVVD